MQAWVWVIVALVVLAVLAIAAWAYRQQQSKRLREQFGPEYSRTVQEYGDARRAEPVLVARAKRVASFHIRPLSPREYERFTGSWRAAQARFVDDPPGAIREADALVTDLMRTRGYPMVDFEQRAADISVDHPQVVEHYRAAHEVALRSSRGEADTEELREGMVHYRSLFEDLLEVQDREPVEASR